MRRSPRFAVFASCSSALLLCLFVAGPAFASHDARRFELDANAMNSSVSGDDWSAVVPTDHSATDIVSSFVDDGPNPPSDTSYFTGGGSKDLNDVTAWAHTTGDVAPDKNEITHAFAVAYRSARDTGKTNVGDLLLYFGLDRYANNGDAQVGFWFFRRSVGMAAGGGFTGSHTVGDILVLSHFTQGGSVSDVNIYSWVGSGGSDGALDLRLTAKDCAAAALDDPACSIVNRSGTNAPWSYTPKAGSAGVFPRGSFYEGGINVTRLVPGVTCFKSFMAETRSSQSVTAQLKDLALGDFDTCPVTTASGPTAPVVPGSPRPSLAVSGSAPTPLMAIVGVVFLVAGFAARSESSRRVRLATASAATRWIEQAHTPCSAGVASVKAVRVRSGR